MLYSTLVVFHHKTLENGQKSITSSPDFTLAFVLEMFNVSFEKRFEME